MMVRRIGWVSMGVAVMCLPLVAVAETNATGLERYEQRFAGSAPAAYRSAEPAFEITVPQNVQGWSIKTRQVKQSPFAFFKSTASKLPFISTSIDFLAEMSPDIQAMWGEPEKLFASKTSSDKQFEKQTLPDVVFVSEKQTTVAGLPALDRVYRSEHSGVTYHSVYVLFREALVTFGLNAFTASFNYDDADFLAILGTLKKIEGNWRRPK